MRLMFVYYSFGDAGSAQDIHHYMRAGEKQGHDVVVYGRPDDKSPFRFSLDIESADALIFVFEWTTQLQQGDQLDLARLLGQSKRARRIVIDCDGAYNDALSIEGDYNHRDEASSRAWIGICDSISDRIFQPTLHPRRPNVHSFFFHGYDPAWEQPLDFCNKEFGMVYVGHSKFRWRPMERVLKAIEPVRKRAGRLAIVGHGWDELPIWAPKMGIEDLYYTDKDYMRKMRVEFVAPCSFDQVVGWMSKAVFNPVIYRPLFSYLRSVTCRTFETPAAGTLPLFGLDREYVSEIYGEAALELMLPNENAHEKIADFLRRPDDYGDVVMAIRRRMNQEHSYDARLRQLTGILSESTEART